MYGCDVYKIIAVFESGCIYTIIGHRSSYLFEYYYYSCSTSSSSAKYITTQLSISDTNTLTVDMNAARTNGVFQFRYSSDYAVTFPFVPNYGSTTSFYNYYYHYICSSSNTLALYMESNFTNVFYQCSSALYISNLNLTGGSNSYKYVNIASDSTKIVGATIGTAGFVYATSQSGAESGKTYKQGVIWKSYVNQQTWDTFNCYSYSSVGGGTGSVSNNYNYAPSYYSSITSTDFSYLNASAVVYPDMNAPDSLVYVEDTDLIPLRPFSSKTDSSGNACELQPPVITQVADKSYEAVIDAADENIITEFEATQCQGLDVNFESTATTSEISATTVSWIDTTNNGFIIKPSEIVDTDYCCNKSVTIDYTANSGTTTNTVTGSFVLNFWEEPDPVVEPPAPVEPVSVLERTVDEPTYHDSVQSVSGVATAGVIGFAAVSGSSSSIASSAIGQCQFASIL